MNRTKHNWGIVNEVFLLSLPPPDVTIVDMLPVLARAQASPDVMHDPLSQNPRPLPAPD